MFKDDAGLFSQGLSVPVHHVLDLEVLVALEGLGQDASRLALGLGGLIKFERILTRAHSSLN